MCESNSQSVMLTTHPAPTRTHEHCTFLLNASFRSTVLFSQALSDIHEKNNEQSDTILWRRPIVYQLEISSFRSSSKLWKFMNFFTASHNIVVSFTKEILIKRKRRQF